ncbi:uncharacterized protein LOC111360518 [Spodoptera litura]|uniref:Uncharacterized protein LOC111348622 n=1 Tax=Spodoptera litura TaxID=69820 RepID=A0A9J7E9E2_SPOLT|nr:uncharacterized protein LOC111348622 [Spodoptera litura]XP_022817068.1 uncharacterized protein LOC111349939 [Spodoptera litura]XP_022823509.1 uncharacterized protein LOC111354329 [Spodoptera litura]XP_022823838.1 uncharacterized protein LOC111354547 [Spodoptera litura]XP_022830785.1 uncharacterized protein LOC111359455 [Spodoptera litura]XP_022832230.1 uncharacterized protein LOC111360518 [Spodoptera litura]
MPSEDEQQPLSFFYRFFSPNIIKDIVDQSNLYSVQVKGRSIQLTHEEFLTFIAIQILMGVVQMPSYTDYWSRRLRFTNIADLMPLKRYQTIRRYIHFIDNNLDDGDRYFKVRPVVEKIRQNCLKIHEEQNFSIDEMMIPYKGTKAGNRRQYIQNKPNKWGFKNFVRAGASGLIYDFILYGGEDTFRNYTFTQDEISIGLGGLVVICINNAWLLYRQNKNKEKSLKEFRIDIYESLLKKGKPVKERSDFTEDIKEERKIKKPVVARPIEEIRYDQVGHFPDSCSYGRCRYCKDGKTNVICIKCNQRLCFVAGKRNCFLNFHKK